jgi:hypothetical protein
MIERLREWWRGYDLEDAISLAARLNDASLQHMPPGTVVPITRREQKALEDGAVYQFDGKCWVCLTPLV